MSKVPPFKSKSNGPTRPRGIPGVPSEVENFMGNIIARFNEAIQGIGSVVNNLAIRIETAIHGLEKKGLLSPAELVTAQREFLEFRDKLQELLQVPGFDRFLQYKEWNESKEVRRIRPMELELHEFAMEDRSLTLEQRLQISEECGFGENFSLALKSKWEHQVPSAATAEEAVDGEEVDAADEDIQTGLRLVGG